MNERIKELAEQAGFVPGVMGLNRYTYFDPEKFAELIVADCVKIVEGYFDTSPEIMGLPLDILEHFDMELNDE